MCTVAAALPAVFQGVSAVASASAQSKQANAAAEAENARYNSTARAALDNYRHSISQLDLRMEEEAAAASQQATQTAAQVAAASGRARSAAGAAGVSGNSVEALISQFASVEAATNASIQTNLKWRERQLQGNKMEAQSGMQRTIDSATPRKYEGPDMLGLGFSLAGAALGGAKDYYRDLPGDQKQSSTFAWAFKPWF